MSLVRVATIAASPDDEARIAQALNERSDTELVMRCVDRVEALAVLRGGDLDALIAIGTPYWFDAEIADEMVRAEVRLVGVGLNGDLAGLAGGIAAALLPPNVPVDELVRRCRDAGTATPPPPPPSAQPSQPKGKLVAVWGPKGAPGRTRVTIELARELASVDRSTILIDADPYGGDVLQSVDIVEDLPTVVWATQLAGRQRLDAARIVTSLRRIGDDGPVLLPGLPRGDLWEEVAPFGWRQLLTVARALFGYTVCDVGFCLEADEHPYAPARPDRNMMARSTVQAADRVVAVCRSDVVGVKNFIWAFDALTKLVDPDDIVVVANHVRANEERSVAELLRKHLGKRPVAYLPTIGNGRQFFSRGVSRQPLGANLRALTASLGAPVKAQGLLTALGGKR